MEMGEVRAKIKLENYRDIVLHKEGQTASVRIAEADALVDTGAVMMLLPQDLVENLGLEIVDTATVTLANEEKIELKVTTEIRITVCNRKMVIDCLVGPPQCELLIGQLVLERLDLIVDPLNRTLTVRPESPYRPSLKLKSVKTIDNRQQTKKKRQK